MDNKSDTIFDTAIIGGGPAGYTAALSLARHGRSVVVFEKDKVGGTCLHRGCIPMKSLLHNASVCDVQSCVDKAVKDTAILYKGLSHQMSAAGVEIITGEAAIVEESDIASKTIISGESDRSGESREAFTVRCGGIDYAAEKVIIAAGSRQVFPSIEGLGSGKTAGWVFSTDDALRFTDWGENVAIVGAGVSGLEIATYLSKIGAKVTIIELADEILGGSVDDDVKEMYLKTLYDAGIRIICSASVCELDDHTVIYEVGGSYDELEAGQVIIASGREANVDVPGLDELNIEIKDGFISVDAYGRTTCEGIYACGDVIGGDMLAHAAYKEAEIVAADICGEDSEVDALSTGGGIAGIDVLHHTALPKVVYTDPEYASCGMSEKTLKAAGKMEGADYKIAKLPMAYSSRYVILEGMKPGLCKLIFDEDDVIIGAQLLGNGAGELIGWVADMVNKHETREQIKRKIYPHPSVCEILREVVSGY